MREKAFRMRTDMFGECNAMWNNEFGSGCWSVNFPESSQGRAANVSLHSDIATSRTGSGRNTNVTQRLVTFKNTNVQARNGFWPGLGSTASLAYYCR